MTLKYDMYYTSADIDAVKACIASIKPLYEQYTGIDIAEAHHQIRRELDMIIKVAEKKRRVAKLQTEIDNITG